MWLAEQVELLASSILAAPEPGGRQPLLLAPQKRPTSNLLWVLVFLLLLQSA